MKPSIFALCIVFASSFLSAQKFVWQPSPGHTQIRYGLERPLIRSLSQGQSTLRRRGKTFFLAEGRRLA